MLPPLEALADMDVLVVATADAQALDGARVPDNARLTSFLPFGQIMPHVSALVTNGGYGGVTIALSHGVPVVTAGSTEDKPEVGNRVQTSGVGIRIKTGTPTPAQVRAAVNSVLGEPSYRERAAAMQAEFGRHDAPREAARLLDQLARTHEPVTRAEAASVSLAQPRHESEGSRAGA
jgi:UDP:flavonoid glycosyltransferase YjiC (YdhE family)